MEGDSSLFSTASYFINSSMSSELSLDDDNPLWRTIMDNIQLILTSLGLLGNGITLLTLSLNDTVKTKMLGARRGFSPLVRMLFLHQAVLDSWVCLMAILLLVQPTMWTSGNKHFDLFLCLAWHGQGMYWGGVLLSIWNLVIISVERFFAVCYPFKHQEITRGKIATALFVCYILSIVLLGPAYLQVRYVESSGECVSEYHFEGKTMEDIMYAYGIFWFFICYAIPCALFCILYGCVLKVFRDRMKDDKLAKSRVIDKANSQLTRTAITVTIFFIIALGFDSWFYILGYAGVLTYDFNTPVQKIGVFFSVMNSCANPFIYATSMPVFRKSIIQTLTCAVCRQDESGDNMTSINSVTGSSRLDTSQNA